MDQNSPLSTLRATTYGAIIDVTFQISRTEWASSSKIQESWPFTAIPCAAGGWCELQHTMSQPLRATLS